MFLLPRRSVLALAAVIDVAVHAKQRPVAAKSLAARHGLPPRHLETLLQELVRAKILKGVRGPLGGYLLARERRRISIADIVAAAERPGGADEAADRTGELVAKVIAPAIGAASAGFFEKIGHVSVHDLCVRTGTEGFYRDSAAADDFHS